MKIAFYHNDELGLNHQELLTKPSSGTVMALLNLAKGLAILQHDVVVLSKAPSTKLDTINYMQINNDQEIINWYKHNHIDVIITVGHVNPVLIELVKIKKSKIFHWHHNYLSLKNIATEVTLGNIDGIISVSPHHMSSLYKHRLFKNITYIRNPIDFNLLKNFNTSNITRSGIAFVGNISAAKGFNEVINAFYNYYLSNGKEILHIYGSDNLYEKTSSSQSFSDISDDIQHKIKVLNKFNMLNFHGKVSREVLYPELSSRKLLLAGLNKTGGAESAGMGIIEAQFMGCQVMTYNRGGQSDSICDKNYIVRFNDDLTEKIEYLLKYTPINNNCNFFNRYDMINIANQWLDLFENKKSKSRHYYAIKARINGILFK